MAVVRRSPRLPTSMSVVVDPAVEDHAEWDGVEVNGAARAATAEAMQISSCLLRQLRLTGSELHRLRLRDCRLEECELSGLIAEGVAMERCELVDCRLSGAVLSSARLRHVQFSNCRMDGVNLRMVAGDVVEFVECDLTSADLYEAKLEHARFVDCRLAQTELSQAHLTGAIFRTSDLGEVRGVASLRGITIDREHAVGLAMALLPEMGITISEIGDD